MAGEQELSLFETILGFIETAFLQVLQIGLRVLPILLAIAAIVVLARYIRGLRDRRPRRRLGAAREFVGGDADYASDFANLLWKLFPDRWKKRRGKG